MNNPTKLILTLKSAATFGRGDGVAGLVDREIEHDPNGFPFLRGKTLKGLLAESAENIVFALKNAKDWRKAKNDLFGLEGVKAENSGILHVGDAQLPSALRSAALASKWKLQDVLYSLTGIRRQTSINEHGAPDHATLRSMRVLLPKVRLEATLSFERDLEPIEEQLLAAAVLDLRHAGTGRNRGRGWIQAELESEDVTQKLFTAFGEALK